MSFFFDHPTFVVNVVSKVRVCFSSDEEGELPADGMVMRLVVSTAARSTGGNSGAMGGCWTLEKTA